MLDVGEEVMVALAAIDDQQPPVTGSCADAAGRRSVGARLRGMPDEDSYRDLTLAEAIARFAHHHSRAENRHISRDETVFLLRAAEVLDELGCTEQVGNPSLFDQ